MEEVKRTNAVVVNTNKWTEFMPWHVLYIIEVDYSKNCYNCGIFEHLVRNCRDQKSVEQKKRVEYRDNQNNG